MVPISKTRQPCKALPAPFLSFNSGFFCSIALVSHTTRVLSKLVRGHSSLEQTVSLPQRQQSGRQGSSKNLNNFNVMLANSIFTLLRSGRR